MGKNGNPTGGRGTKHHCPGKSGWVGDESPGGCDEDHIGNMEAKKEKEAKKNQEVVEKGKEDEAFWNPGKGRKK
ncbi:unnamed protein product [Alternaria alternata]